MASGKKKADYAAFENSPSANIYEEEDELETAPATNLNNKFSPALKIYSTSASATPDPDRFDRHQAASTSAYTRLSSETKKNGQKLSDADDYKSNANPSSVELILDELQSKPSIADSEYGRMEQMLAHKSQSSMVIKGDPLDTNQIFVPSALGTKQQSVDSVTIEYDDSNNYVNDVPTEEEKMRTKYKQLKEKYKKLKSLRTNNDKLVAENKRFEQQIIELQQQVVKQKNTIIRQNRNLLKIQTERDDLEDVVEEQLQEKRMSQAYGGAAILPFDTAPLGLLAASPLDEEKPKLNLHQRSATSPDVPSSVGSNQKAINSILNNRDTIDEDEEHSHNVHFREDTKFTVTVEDANHDLDAMDENPDIDDNEEEEQKYAADSRKSPSSIRPVSAKSDKGKKTPRFVLVDDIPRETERKYYSMSRSVLTSEVNPYKVKDEWALIIGPDTDDITIVEQSSEICDAWKINECECVKRLLFILKYYSQWLNHKTAKSKRKSRGRRDVLQQLSGLPEDENIESKRNGRGKDKGDGYTESITDFINGGKLEYYNHVQLMNDFYHIKKYHMSDPDISETVFKHFVNEFGFCDVKHCTSFKRNHRENTIFGHHNRFRRKVYHLDHKKFESMDEYDAHNDNSYELHEINLQQCLDMIHSTLIHDYHNTTTDDLTEFAKQLLQSPMPTDDGVGSPHEESYGSNVNTPINGPYGFASNSSLHGHIANQSNSSLHGGGPKDTTTAFKYRNLVHSESITKRGGASHAPSSTPLAPLQEDISSATQDVFAYGFGVRFSYWIPEWPDFVQPQYSDLRSELLENEIYRISAFEWDLLQHRAAIFMQTNHGLYEYLAKFKGSGNELMKIKPESHLTINHLIALYTYTNYPNIRISFQKACLRTTPNETFVSVLKRHEQIANWARLLYEAVYLFGHRMTNTENFYHILRSKIMLSKFSANLSCPTTMISNRKIVNNSNIVMQVQNAHSRGATSLDISYFSDVPNRGERLFFFGDLAFDNIIIRGTSYRHYIKSLTLFQKIVQGSYFSHTSLKKKSYQRTIVHFMKNMIKSKDNGGVSNYVQMLRERKKYNDEDIIADNDVPLYIQHLFDYFCSKLKIIWINQEEFISLQPELQRYLAKERLTTITSINELILTGQSKQSMMGAFTKFLHFEYAINFKYCCTLHWEISSNAFKQFWKGNKIFGQEFRVSTIRLFPYCVKDSSKNDGQFRFGIPIKSMPKYLKKIEFRVDLYIPEINYTFSAYSIIDERGTYWYSLFDSSLLRNFSKFTLKISFRLINLMVSNGIPVSNMINNDGQRSNPRSSSFSLYKIEDFRKNSTQGIENMARRFSKKFQRNSGAAGSL